MIPTARTLTVVVAACGFAAVLGCQPPSAQSGADTTAAPPPAYVPSGTVVAYFGTEIPAGWVLCDGRTTAGGRITPDLRGRFVLGLDPAADAVGEKGGSEAHTHKARTGEPEEDDEDLESGKDEHAANDGHTHGVTVDAAGHLPPYVKLVYIMKE
ncbi:MAG: hypothetical protein ACOY3Y_07065 [Acidobacteriota bacterium]